VLNLGAVYDHRALQRARERAGITVAQLAARTGLSIETLDTYERGILTPTSLRLRQMAVGIGVSVDSLFDRRDPDDPVVRATRDMLTRQASWRAMTAEEKAMLADLIRPV